MKINITTVFCSIFLSVSVFAQDVITYKNGNEVNAKVTEVNPTDVKFIMHDSLGGAIHIVPLSNIFMITYKNGYKDVFTEAQVVIPEIENKIPVQENKTPVVVENKTPTVETKEDDELIERRRYGGPRVGCTYVGQGAFADALLNEGKRNIYSQFGWQIETRMFKLNNGLSGMIEFVPLIGGLDMGKFIPSASLLLGLRAKNGIEVGVGPNYVIYGSKDMTSNYKLSSNLGIVIAAGMSFKSDKVYFPINIAVVPSVTKTANVYDPITLTTVSYKYETGIKLSLLVGFNYKKSR